jgi:alpha-glucosidase (family GH31 glycosyl hydrolase)
MFGDSFLVAPVVSHSNRCQVYLPDGAWIDYWTKEVQTSPRWLETEAPLDLLPLWVRVGAIVPTGPPMDYAEEKPLDPLTLELYLPQGDSETLVHDEDMPDIPVRYSRRGADLKAIVDAAPGQVEVILYGITARTARHNGRPLLLEPCRPGQLVRFDGTKPSEVVFLLSE